MRLSLVARRPAQASLRHWFSRACGALLLIGLLDGLATPALADPQAIKINRIKAAFVFNIAKFVTWPSEVYETRPGRLMTCFYREDFLGRGFESINGKTVKGRRVEKHLINSIANAAACDIVLIPASQLFRYDEEASQFPAHPVLTIADQTNHNPSSIFHDGVVVNLVRHGAGIGFEVNLQQVRQRGLEMSSELLKLARIIDPVH